MTQLQLIFNRVNESKKELKKIKLMYRDALANSKSYQNIIEEMKVLRDKKSKIENAIKDDFNAELAKSDVLKSDIDNDMMLLADKALIMFAKGETVEVEDSKGNKVNPVFSVKFKK